MGDDLLAVGEEIRAAWIGKARQGCNCLFQKKNSGEGGHKVQGSVDPMFEAGLPFLVTEIQTCKVFRDSGQVSG